ncbi:MAG TPA: hypothetical protein PK306_25030 [Aquabacterium sp.]|nr:hypothetical protein [Aquabacterium sp.]
MVHPAIQRPIMAAVLTMLLEDCTLLRLSTLLALISLVAGCANVDYGKHLEAKSEAPATVDSNAPLGTLNLYFEGAAMRQIGEPPQIVAMDGVAVGILPPGSR